MTPTRLEPSPPTAPQAKPLEPARAAQSLAGGLLGTVLPLLEHPTAGTVPWDHVHQRLYDVVQAGIDAERGTLFYGAPALAYVLDLAALDTPRYTQALTYLDDRVTRITRAKLAAARRRRTQDQRPELSEFDLINGLTGLGVVQLQRHPDGNLLRQILHHLVALTRSDDDRPGWWTDQPPTGRRAAYATGGHANFGLAHGIAGPLALLAITARIGITVPGQHRALHRILAWYDAWEQHDGHSTWWPETLTTRELRHHHTDRGSPGRPSWCYGTPGVVRALQLAALALHDHERQAHVETALLRQLDEPVQFEKIIDHGLCHGWAGVYQTTCRIARDATVTGFDQSLDVVAAKLRHHDPPDLPYGFLDGASGTELAITATLNPAPRTDWDRCLLLT